MPRIALVHDWFNEAGGAEKVVREILHCYPDADVFCLFDFFNDQNRKYYLNGKPTISSYIQKIPYARQRYRNFFPIFPSAIESLDLTDYDIIISSSSCVAKGILRKKGQLHISYCHSPARYAWDLKDDYLRAAKSAFSKRILKYFFEKLRKWDLKSSDRVDYFIANSCFVQDRIKRFFNRESTVIYPPVDIEMKGNEIERGDFYFSVSRLVTYKNVDMIVDAFRLMPELKLEIAGDGPMRKKTMKNLPPNVKYLGYIDDETKRHKISTAKAFVAAATEDFGISIVEAQSYCTPVIIPSVGGYKETVNENTGVFFHEKTVGDMVATIREFHSSNRSFLREHFENNIKSFGIERFCNEFKAFTDDKINRHFTGKQQ
jgi:glycosyltransferase involved in cell wall biosynthesis